MKAAPHYWPLYVEEYGTLVGDIFAGRSELEDLVGTEPCAVQVTCEAFCVAKRQVRILIAEHHCDRLTDQRAYNAIKAFLQRPEASLIVLVEVDGETAVHELKELAMRFPAQVTLGAVPPDCGWTYNFMLVDDTGYRYEQDRNLPGGVIAGGDTQQQLFARLAEIFAAHLEQANLFSPGANSGSTLPK